jgi:hypothetical protein
MTTRDAEEAASVDAARKGTAPLPQGFNPAEFIQRACAPVPRPAHPVPLGRPVRLVAVGEGGSITTLLLGHRGLGRRVVASANGERLEGTCRVA